MISIDFEKLKIARPALFRSAVAQLGYGTGGDAFSLVLGVREIPDDAIDPDLHRLLNFWISAEKPAAPVAEEPAASAPPQKPVEPLLSEEELVQRATDQARGFSRLQQFSDEQGLEESPANCSLVDVWLSERGFLWSQDNVDKAVLSLKNVLTWKAKTVEPPPPDPEPTEVLKPGQLSLNASQEELRRASPEQLKDYLARTREATGKYLRPRGSWGSSF